MKYIVVRPNKTGSTLTMVDESAVLDLPFEAWALRTGKQIIYVQKSMHADLKPVYLWGTLQKAASYDLDYGDMLLIMEEKLGPSDRQRFEAVQPVHPQEMAKHVDIDWAFLLNSFATFVFKCVWGIFRVIGFAILFIVLLKWMKNRRH